MLSTEDSSTFNTEQIARVMDRFETTSITEEEARGIMTELKSAIENGDERSINAVCNRLIGNDEKEGPQDCATFLGIQNVCTSISMQYNTIDSENNNNPGSYISVMDGKIGNCDHTFMYVDSKFEGFLDQDISFLTGLGINTIDIINLETRESIYSGILVNKVDIDQKANKDKRDGWLILIGVIIFIGMGILIKKQIN